MRDTPASLGSEDLEQKLLVPVVAKAAEVEASAVTGAATVVVITPDGKRERQVVSYSQLVYAALSYWCMRP
jgi:hypothetical protein